MQFLTAAFVVWLLQLHPCDLQPLNGDDPVKGRFYGWCHEDPQDTFVVTIGGTSMNVGKLQPLTTANAVGLYFFQIRLPDDMKRGVYQVYVQAVGPDGVSPPSDVCWWRVGPGKPRRPSISGKG